MITNIINIFFVLYGLIMILFAIRHIKEKNFPLIFFTLQNILTSFTIAMGAFLICYVPYIQPFLATLNNSHEIVKIANLLNQIDIEQMITYAILSIVLSGCISKILTGYNLLKFRIVFLISVFLYAYSNIFSGKINSEIILFIVFFSYIVSTIIFYVKSNIIKSKFEKSKYDIAPKINTLKTKSE